MQSAMYQMAGRRDGVRPGGRKDCPCGKLGAHNGHARTTVGRYPRGRTDEHLYGRVGLRPLPNRPSRWGRRADPRHRSQAAPPERDYPDGVRLQAEYQTFAGGIPLPEPRTGERTMGDVPVQRLARIQVGCRRVSRWMWDLARVMDNLPN